MRIVLDSALNAGSAEYANLGDVAMLQVGVRRLRRLWPSAQIDVLTDSPTQLALFCPEANALPRSGGNLWVGDNAILGRFIGLLPRAAAVGFCRLARGFRLRYPDGFRRLLHLKLRIRDSENVRPQLDAFTEAINQADLYVVCGAGGFTDSAQAWTNLILNTLEEMAQRDVASVMFGQGMGPLHDLEVRSRARSVLPKVSLLTLRGARGGEELAQSLGLSRAATLTTGDEAVEMAYGARAIKFGEAVGVNLRVAAYSTVTEDTIEKLGTVLQAFARRHKVPLLPVPIAFHAWANDPVSIKKLLQGIDDYSDGGIELDTPMKVIQQVGRCRVVVTGAYHAAVFALSQGIPVVALSASEGYTANFLGLKEQFGPGCEIVLLDSPDAYERMAEIMEKTWQSAEEVRSPLLQAAQKQIEASWQAYEIVRDRIVSRPAGKAQPRGHGEQIGQKVNVEL